VAAVPDGHDSPREGLARALTRLQGFPWPQIVFVAAIVAVVGPWTWNYPADGLDPSWRMAINRATAEHLAFGRDIVFTHGPFGLISTSMYDPALRWLAVLGGMLLAVGAAAAALPLLRSAPRVTACLAAVAIVASSALSVDHDVYKGSPSDGLLITYPLLVMARLVQMRVASSGGTSIPSRLTLVVIAVPLALLPLIKVSALPLWALVSVIGVLVIWPLDRVGACTFGAAATLGMPALWVLAGQPLSALPAFLVTSLELISGYSEAMSTTEASLISAIPTIVCSLLLCTACMRADLPRRERVLLSLMLAATLVLSFKSASVRSHLMSGTAGLLAATAVVCLFSRGRAIKLVLAGAVVVTAFQPLMLMSKILADRLVNTPVAAVTTMLAPQRLDARYKESMRDIRQLDSIPHPEDDTDIYTVAQAQLLAHQVLLWNPRPIFQSYSAYTPSLIRINERHLTGSDGPRHVLLKLQTIDERLPTLDDGPSLVALLRQYRLKAYDRKRLTSVFERRSVKMDLRPGRPIEISGELSRPVDLPQDADVWLAAVHLDPSLIGKLRAAAWRPAQVRIDLRLSTGRVIHRRLVPRMAQSGFLLSPYLNKTSDVAALVSGPARRQHLPTVRTMTIRAKGWGWRHDYSLSLIPLDMSQIDAEATAR